MPVLQKNVSPITKTSAIETWANQLLEETRKALNTVLPFKEEEKAFLDCLQDHGEIRPEFICKDEDFCHRVK